MTMAQAVYRVSHTTLGRSLARRLPPRWKQGLRRWIRLDPARLVSRQWDRQVGEEFMRDVNRRSWGGIPQVHSNHNYLTTGSRDVYWIAYLRDRYFPGGDAGDTLALGCGEGHVDRIFKDQGFRFRSFTGIDISPASVQRAQELAEQVKLSPRTRYFTADLNHYELPQGAYDFIYFFQSLHHIESLEHVLAGCAAALRPGGWLMVNEFVGPSRFQWTQRQQEMADRLVGLLPPQLRVNLLHGALKKGVSRPTVEDMIATDPSEAVRSAEIELELKRRFEVVEEKNWGGTLNHLVFADIAGNFNPQDPLHECIVELLIHHENTLIEHGVLPSDFKLYMARRR